VSLFQGPEAAIDAGIVGDIELNELRTEFVGGRAPLLLVARGQDRSEALLDQLPHDLATNPSIRTRNKSESTIIRHRRSRSHPRRLRPGGCLGPARQGPSTRLTDTSARRSAIERPDHTARGGERARAGTTGFSDSLRAVSVRLPPGKSGRSRPDPPSARPAGSGLPDRRDGRQSGADRLDAVSAQSRKLEPRTLIASIAARAVSERGQTVRLQTQAYVISTVLLGGAPWPVRISAASLPTDGAPRALRPVT
jgi:hypothetical protein